MSFAEVSRSGRPAASALMSTTTPSSSLTTTPSSLLSALSPPPAPTPAPPPAAAAAADLRGGLRALRANNTALRRLSAELRSVRPLRPDDASTAHPPPPPPALRRVRELRAQSRDLAHAAAALAARLPDSGNDPASTRLRRELADAVADFGEALRDSVQAEASAVAADLPDPATVAVTVAAAGASDGRRSGTPTEGTPLLASSRPSTPAGNKQPIASIATSTLPPGGSRKACSAVAVAANAAAKAEEEEAVSSAAVAESIAAAATEPGSISATVSVNAAHQRELLAIETLRVEREEAIRDVQASIHDVNAIFKDIAVMVGDQAVQVEYVEVQMGDANDAIRAARQQLNAAQRRREAKKKVFFRALFFIALIVAIILVVLLS